MSLPVNDGLHEIFVNTVIDDGTDIAELMSCFTKKEVNNPKFPHLSNEVSRLKSEGGVSTMSAILDSYIKEAVEKNTIEVEKRTSNEAAIAMLRDGVAVDVIAKYIKLSIPEIEELQKEITE